MRVWNLFGALRHRVETRLNRRLILVLVTVLASVSTAFLAMVLWIYQSRLIEQHARASLEVNQLLQASLENAMLKRDINGLRAIVDRLGTQDGIAQVMIVNPDREIRFSSRAGLIGTVQNDVLIDKALAALEPVTAFVSGGEGGEWLRSVNPVRNKPPCKECHGAAEDHPVNGLLVVDYKAAGIRGDALRSAGLLGASGAVVILFSGPACGWHSTAWCCAG